MPRILAAVTGRDGDVSVVNIGRPAALVAFGDQFGKTAPESYKEMAWLAHRALAPEGVPLAEWLETLEDLDANEATVARVERKLRGDLEPHELLAELDAGDFIAMSPDEFVQLRDAAKRRLDELEADRERKAKEAAEKAAAERADASRRLDEMPVAELDALPVPERELLYRQAGRPVPTIAAPATTGGGA